MKQCKECPFKKTSVQGWLGTASHDPELFLKSIENQPTPCHMAIQNWNDADEIDKKSWSSPCVGSLKFMRNSSKLPREQRYRKMRDGVEKDSTCFETRQEFIDHHGKSS